MNLYAVIPLTKIPRRALQLPVYFSTHNLREGQLVEVPLGRRTVTAIIVKRYGAQEHRQQLRKSSFVLKNITRVLSKQPILDKALLHVAHRLADYYYEPLGLVLRRMLPPFFTKPTRPLLKMLETLPAKNSTPVNGTPKTTLIVAPHRKRLFSTLAKNGAPYIFVVAEYGQLEHSAGALPKKHHVAVLAQSTTQTAWRDVWLKAQQGVLDGVLGTRSALFIPLARARTLFVEHENSDAHKSWDQHPKLDTRRSALELREAYGMHVVFSDTLPSLETWWRAHAGKWNIDVQLPSTLPALRIIDMQKEQEGEETPLLSAPARALLVRAGSTSKLLLFTNRRGLTSALLCRDCATVVRCEQCDAPFVLHNHTLVCHHCGVKQPAPSTCPTCNGTDFKHLGGGTQRIEHEVRGINPRLRVARIDSDATPTLIEQQRVLREFRTGKINVVIGTSAALKEDELPRLDASIMISPDTLLMLPAYRSTERVFDVLWRLRTISKKVLVQTHHPELPVFSYAQKRTFEPFFNDELAKREALGWPPFVQVVKMTFSHRLQGTAETEAKALTRRLDTQMRNLSRNNTHAKVLLRASVLGPAPAFTSKVGGRYEWYALLKWPRDKRGAIENLSLRNRLLDAVPPTWDIDVDPVDVV